MLLLNLGGPDTLDDVRPFLYNLFADPDIIRLPRAISWLQPLIAWGISTRRAPKAREAYESIGGGSPLRRLTDEQGAALRAALGAAGVPVTVAVAMRYWAPFTDAALAKLRDAGVNKVVVLPLYPQYSVSTTGSSLRALRECLARDPAARSMRFAVVPHWCGRPGYVAAVADLIETELATLPDPERVVVFFSAHGVPVKYVEAGDPYQSEMEWCVKLVVGELRARGLGNRCTLAYQSRVGPVQWLTPYTDDAIRELGAEGVHGLLAVPIAFVSEHIETLEEIDMEYRWVGGLCEGGWVGERVGLTGSLRQVFLLKASCVQQSLGRVWMIACDAHASGRSNSVTPLGHQ